MLSLYQVTNLINSKHYIGVHECGPRCNGGCSYFGSGVGIRRAIKKYGKENFRKDILAEVETERFAYQLEAAVVDQAFVGRADTYNLMMGGLKGPNQTGLKHSPETRLRIGAAAHSRQLGQPLSAEHKQHIAVARQGYRDSSKTRQKKSEAAKRAWARRDS